MQYPARNTAAGTRTQPTPEGSRPWNPPSIEAQLVLPWLPRRHRSRLQCKEIFAVQEDKRSDAERSGTPAFEPSGAAHEGVGPGADMDIGQGWGGIDDLGEAPCRLLCSTPGLDSGARMARSAPCKTDTGCRHPTCGASCCGPVLESMVLDDRYSSTRRRRSNRGEN